jgi:hypothetical protein
MGALANLCTLTLHHHQLAMGLMRPLQSYSSLNRIPSIHVRKKALISCPGHPVMIVRSCEPGYTGHSNLKGDISQREVIGLHNCYNNSSAALGWFLSSREVINGFLHRRKDGASTHHKHPLSRTHPAGDLPRCDF